jgi:hypothetical protein
MTDAKITARILISEDGPYVVTGHIPLAKQTISTDTDTASGCRAKIGLGDMARNL